MGDRLVQVGLEAGDEDVGAAVTVDVGDGRGGVDGGWKLEGEAGGDGEFFEGFTGGGDGSG